MTIVNNIDIMAIANDIDTIHCASQCATDTADSSVCCYGTEYTNICEAQCAGHTEDACVVGTCIECDCELNWYPLCCNDRDYFNPCEAKCIGIEEPLSLCEIGTCMNRQCICASVLDPYCCDGNDFDNACVASCNGFIDINYRCKPGKCALNCLCPSAYHPICCDGVTFTNECQAKCQGYDLSSADSLCSLGTCESNECLCSLEYEPICCDGETYMNGCHAVCNGIESATQPLQDTCSMGSCDELCMCPHYYNPICCDGREFSNECVARCNGIFNTQLCSTGLCNEQEDCVCSREYDPLCCADETYANSCIAECVGNIKHPAHNQSDCELGICNVCTCPTTYDPVCCSNVDFDNECIAHCYVDVEDANIWCVGGTCNENNHCTLEYDPVCCVQGREQITYDNQCIAQKNNAETCSSGPCEFVLECECDAAASLDPYCCHTPSGKRQFDNSCVAECNGIEDAARVCEPGVCDIQPCGCALEYEPLCCDDITYYNPCIAQCYGVEEEDACEAGTCAEVRCGCDTTYEPFCCHGVDYMNTCDIACGGIVTDRYLECSEGTCGNQLYCVCTNEYNPICCEGQDFSNPCVASCSGNIIDTTHCLSGRCDAQNHCVCARDYEPICCVNIDYAHGCLAECDGFVTEECSMGRCTPSQAPVTSHTNAPTDHPLTAVPITTPEMCHCALVYAPVCCEGREYDNACLAECHLHVEDATNECVDGRCIQWCDTDDYNPICCMEITYHNPCIAETQGNIEAPAAQQSECVMGSCSVPSDIDSFDCGCSDRYDPRCCLGKTYTNVCHVRCDGISHPKKHCKRGACVASSISGAEPRTFLSVIQSNVEQQHWNYLLLVIEISIFAVLCGVIGVILPFIWPRTTQNTTHK